MALCGSQGNVSHPIRWNGILDPLLKAAGVRSWKSFVANASCVEIEQEGDEVVLVPMRNLGLDGGYEALNEKQVTVFVSSDSLLGSKLREALAQVE
jgi:hypothetical protein